MSKKTKEVFPIQIHIPKKPKLIFPKSLTVPTIAYLSTRGLSSVPPTPAICTAVKRGKEILKHFGGGNETCYRKALKIKQGKELHTILITGTPDRINRTDDKITSVTELRTFSSSSSRSKENAINLSITRICLYLWLIGIPELKGKIILFDISQLVTTPVEFIEPIIFNTSIASIFKNSVITALKVYTIKKKAEKKVIPIVKEYQIKIKKSDTFKSI